MVTTDTDRTLATLAQMRLERLAACASPVPVTQDGYLVCGTCGFLVLSDLRGVRHSADDERAMRRIVQEGERA